MKKVEIRETVVRDTEVTLRLSNGVNIHLSTFYSGRLLVHFSGIDTTSTLQMEERMANQLVITYKPREE